MSYFSNLFSFSLTNHQQAQQWRHVCRTTYLHSRNLQARCYKQERELRIMNSEPTLTNGRHKSCELNDGGSDWSSLSSARRTGVDDARSLHFVAAQNLTARDDLGAAGCLRTGQGARNDFVRRVNFHLCTLWLRGIVCLDEYVMMFQHDLISLQYRT